MPLVPPIRHITIHIHGNVGAQSRGNLTSHITFLILCLFAGLDFRDIRCVLLPFFYIRIYFISCFVECGLNASNGHFASITIKGNPEMFEWKRSATV